MMLGIIVKISYKNDLPWPTPARASVVFFAEWAGGREGKKRKSTYLAKLDGCLASIATVSLSASKQASKPDNHLRR